MAADKSDFSTRHPGGDELLLVVEVSDSTAIYELHQLLSGHDTVTIQGRPESLPVADFLPKL